MVVTSEWSRSQPLPFTTIRLAGTWLDEPFERLQVLAARGVIPFWHRSDCIVEMEIRKPQHLLRLSEALGRQWPCLLAADVPPDNRAIHLVFPYPDSFNYNTLVTTGRYGTMARAGIAFGALAQSMSQPSSRDGSAVPVALALRPGHLTHALCFLKSRKQDQALFQRIPKVLCDALSCDQPTLCQSSGSQREAAIIDSSSRDCE